MTLRFLLVSFALIGFAVAGPAYILKKCSSSDSKCMKESAKAAIPAFAKGIPELGVKPMDPLILKEIDASSSSLKFILRDFKIVGLSSCTPKKIQLDVSKSLLYLRLICDVEANGLYEMKGNLLVLPIEGNDQIHLKVKKIDVNADVSLDTSTGTDGKKYLLVKDWRYSFELKEKSDLVFDKLFEKNYVLRSAANELVANHSNEIIKEVGQPIIKALVEKIVDNVKAFFDHVPYEEVLLD